MRNVWIDPRLQPFKPFRRHAAHRVGLGLGRKAFVGNYRKTAQTSTGMDCEISMACSIVI